MLYKGPRLHLIGQPETRGKGFFSLWNSLTHCEVEGTICLRNINTTDSRSYIIMTIWSLTIMWLTRDKNVCLYYVQLHIPIWRRNMWKQLLSWATYCSYLLHVLMKKKENSFKISLSFSWLLLNAMKQQSSTFLKLNNTAHNQIRSYKVSQF